MENKENIVMRLKLLLKVTRAGSAIEDLILNDKQDMVIIQFDNGNSKKIDIAGDSGIAIIKDVISRL